MVLHVSDLLEDLALAKAGTGVDLGGHASNFWNQTKALAAGIVVPPTLPTHEGGSSLFVPLTPSHRLMGWCLTPRVRPTPAPPMISHAILYRLGGFER